MAAKRYTNGIVIHNIFYSIAQTFHDQLRNFRMKFCITIKGGNVIWRDKNNLRHDGDAFISVDNDIELKSGSDGEGYSQLWV